MVLNHTESHALPECVTGWQACAALQAFSGPKHHCSMDPCSPSAASPVPAKHTASMNESAASVVAAAPALLPRQLEARARPLPRC